MAGAAKCFYGFVGFDTIATTGEEAKNPKRDIPLAIVFSLIIIFFAYFGISTVLTMMWPYYDQDPNAPFPYVFEALGLEPIKYIVTGGAIIALSTALLGAMFPLPRVLYSMSSDGIIYKFMSHVCAKNGSPIVATIVSGILTGIMALIFDLQQLIDMMSIGTLLAYTIVAICVLVLRYHESNPVAGQHANVPISTVCKQIFNLNFIKEPNSISSLVAKWALLVFCK
jgi:amino acid transporter